MPSLSEDEVRQLLAECVTVVKPGEVLVLRCPEGWTPRQVEAMSGWASCWLEDNAPDIRVMVVPYLEMAVVQPETDEQLAERVKRVMPGVLRREMQRAAANR